jgi:opacity protein-like surface antigen
MMKRLILISFFLTTTLYGISQTNASYSFGKGSSLFSLGYGIGNIWKNFLQQGLNYSVYEVKSIGPFVLNYDYGVNKKLSIGASASYSKLNGEVSRFQISDQLTITSILLRSNYHFGRFKNFDPYLGAGVGYVQSKYTNNSSLTNPNVPGEFGYSAQLGAHYYLTKYFGFYAEAGYVGGSFLQLGISVKTK